MLPWSHCTRTEGLRRQHLHDIHPCEATAATRHLASGLRCVDPCLAVTKFVRTADLTDEGGDECADAVSTAAASQEISALTPLVTRRASIQCTLQHLCIVWRTGGTSSRSLTPAAAAAAAAATVSDVASAHVTPPPAPYAVDMPMVVVDNWDDDEPAPAPAAAGTADVAPDSASAATATAAATTASAATIDMTVPSINIESMGTVYQFVMDRCAALRQQLVRVTSAHAALDAKSEAGTVTRTQIEAETRTETEAEKEKERSVLRSVYMQLCSLYLEMLHSCAIGDITKPISNRSIPSWYDPHMHLQSLQSCVAASAMVPVHVPVPEAAACAYQDQLRQLSLSLQVLNAVTRAFAPLVIVAQATQTHASTTTSGSAASAEVAAATAEAAVAALPAVLPISLAHLQIQPPTETETETETGSAEVHMKHTIQPSAQDILLRLCGNLNRMNTSGAMNGVMRTVGHARGRRTSADTMRAADDAGIPTSFTAINASLPLFLQALLPIMPYMRLHRLLLLCYSANRGEVLSVRNIAKKLYLDDDAACLQVIQALELTVSVPIDISVSAGSTSTTDVGCHLVVLRPLLSSRGAVHVTATGTCAARNAVITIQQACNALHLLQKIAI